MKTIKITLNSQQYERDRGGETSMHTITVYAKKNSIHIFIYT